MSNEEFVFAYNIKEEPKTYEEVMKSIDAIFWKEAINSELVSTLSNHACVSTDLVSTGLPWGCKPLGSNWIFKEKIKTDGSIGNPYKARLVMKRFNQKKEVDYFDTYAHLSKIATIKAFLHLLLFLA